MYFISLSFLIGGYYCPGGAVVYPTLPCSAGYYCREGAETSTPIEDSDANECPAGYYCPQQTDEPIACPVGSFSNALRRQAEVDCTACTPGKMHGRLAMCCKRVCATILMISYISNQIFVRA